MTHCSDDDLLLEYYGETPAAAHRSGCAECTARYRELEAFLQGVTLEPPERDERYGLEVWQQIRHRLPAPEPGWRSWFAITSMRWTLASAAALLLLSTGFAAGRLWSAPQARQAAVRATVPTAETRDQDVRRRVVLMTVADHFDRSHRVLTDIMNASSAPDLTTEQQWASDLVAASRLYRQDVIDIDEPGIAAVLEELERVLLDVVHQPSRATDRDLEEIRRRIDSAALLFKVRVMSNELQQQLETASPAPSTSTSNIG